VMNAGESQSSWPCQCRDPKGSPTHGDRAIIRQTPKPSIGRDERLERNDYRCPHSVITTVRKRYIRASLATAHYNGLGMGVERRDLLKLMSRPRRSIRDTSLDSQEFLLT